MTSRLRRNGIDLVERLGPGRLTGPHTVQGRMAAAGRGTAS